MTEGTELPQEVKEVPQETKEVAEARQELDRATLEPAAAVERSADIKTAEAVEAAVVEAVAADAAIGDRRPETGDREVAAPASTEDGGRETGEAAVPAADRGQETGDREGAAGAATEDGGPVTEDREAEAIETILTSDIANTSASTDASRDAYKEAIDTLQEHAQRQNQVADIGSRPSAPPEGDPGAEDLSDESPVQAVSSTAAETSTDFTAEMTGAQPGEVRGFAEEEDGSQTYELKTDGRNESQTVQEQVENLEAARESPAESAVSVTLRPVEETASPAEQESAESGEAQRGEVPQETTAPSLGVEAPEDSATAAVSGGASPHASGLPLDDDLEGGEAKPTETGEEGGSAENPETSSETLADGLSQALVTETAGSPLPGGMVISGALDGMTQLKEATGNGGSDEGELSPTEDSNDESDSPVDATPQTSSVSGIGETGDDQENTEAYELQIAALEKRIETLEKQKLAQLQEMLKDIWTEEPVKPSREDFPSGEYGDADYADAINTYNNQTEDFQQQIFQLQSQITNTDETIHALQDEIKIKSEEIQQATKKINDLMGMLGSESNQNIPTDPVDSPSGSIGISTDSGSAAPPPSGTGLNDD